MNILIIRIIKRPYCLLNYVIIMIRLLRYNIFELLIKKNKNKNILISPKMDLNVL